MLPLYRHGDAPFDAGARDGEIVQPAFHERDDFVAARVGLDPFRVLLVEIQQALLEGRELEEIILLGHSFRRTAAIGARIARLGFVDIKFAIEAVLASVGAFVYVTVFHAAVEEPADGLVVFGIGSAYPAVHFQAEDIPLAAKFVGDARGVVFGGEARLLRGALHILAVLVGAGEHVRLVALHVLEAPDHVGGHGGIGVAYVRRGIHVIERSGEVVFHFEFFK